MSKPSAGPAAPRAGKSRLVQAAAILLSLVLFAALFFYARAGRSTYDRDGIGIAYETARVVSVLSDNTEIEE